ncbi:hypothetical protein PInf_014370 [Phytophthora infestans]|nr:hypothetical protein PInf_014370 [Phytophthora infestans]
MRGHVHFRENVDDAREIVELHPLLQWDMTAITWLVQQKEERPWLRTLVHSTTSRRRTQDISLLIWFVFITMIPEFGFPYFWICIGNLLAVLILQTVAILHTHSAVVQLIFAAVVLYIALCKLLLATRFISQVLGSWLMGFTGILIGNHGHVVVKSYKLTRGYNTAAIVAIVVLLMLVLGMWIENNDSSLMGIPKRDFMDVFTNILNSDAPTPATTPAQVHQLPTRPTMPTRQQNQYVNEEDDQVAGKRDSFYFLVRGMRARAARETL